MNHPSTIPRKASFLGIGAQKCATTWVHRVLQDHPQAAVSEPKELDFFSANYERGFQWYDAHFDRADATAAIAAGEISPSYFHDREAPARARDYNPSLRIVLTVRDPLARAYSNHLHEVRIGHYNGPDLRFEAGWANNPMYLEQSLYAKHLRNWLAHFSRDSILVLVQEEIEQDPVAHARKLYAFLGLDTEHQSAALFRRVNQSAEEKLKGMNRVLRGFGKFGRRLGVRALVNSARRSALVTRLRDANRRHLDTVVPPMAPETRARMRALLIEDAREFAQLVQRSDLPWSTLRENLPDTAQEAIA